MRTTMYCTQCRVQSGNHSYRYIDLHCPSQ